MGRIELKSNLHDLIDEIDNNELLESIYEILTAGQSNNNSLWSELSKSQKAEVLKAYEESNDPGNLIPHSEVMRELK